MSANRLFLLMLCGLGIGSLCAQGSLDQTFLRRYNLNAMQGGLAITTSQDGGFVATGQHQNNGSAGGCDVYVYKVDACGNRDWFNLYGTGDSEGGKSIEPTSDGGYVIGGARFITMGVDLAGNPIVENEGLVMRIDALGTPLWYNAYDQVTWVFDVQPMASGFVAIGEADQRPVLLRLDDSGQVLWSKRYPSMSANPLMIEPLDDGGFVFVANQPLSGRDVEVCRLDAAGNPLWMKSFGAGFGPNEHIAWGCNALVNEEGAEVYVLAPTVTGGIGGEDILLMKLSLEDGDVIWSRAVGSPGDDLGRDLIFAQGGLALLGSTDGYGASVLDYPDALSQDLAEQDILLTKLSVNGGVEWSKIYGGNERDKAVGVRFDQALGYTMSAYTSSSVFGNTDGSMDPLFIRADFDGAVACQSVSVSIASIPVAVASQDISSGEVFITQAMEIPIVTSAFEPEDVYQCQTCYNEPAFEAEANLVCMGDTVRLFNTTEVGLRCYQNWEITGDALTAPIGQPGLNDTVLLVFNEPGVYQVKLTSECDDSSIEAVAEIEVLGIEAEAQPDLAFNGFAVSCSGESDGTIESAASGGIQSGDNYVWEWQDEWGDVVGQEQLPAGSYTGFVVNETGCADTVTVVLTAPPALQMVATPFSDYNGFAVSCEGAEDGQVALQAAGGIPEYVYPLPEGLLENDTVTGLGDGDLVFTVIDANGCVAFDSIALDAPSPPFLQLQVEPDTCGASSGILQANFSSVVPPNAVVWPANLGLAQELSAFSELQTGLPAGEYAVELFDGNGCMTLVEVEIPSTSPSDVRFISGPQTVCFPGAVVDFEDLTPGVVLSRMWDFGDGNTAFKPGGEATENLRTQHTYLSVGVFEVELTVENDEGCASSDVLTVEVLEAMMVFVPSAFTPDNDGVNDGFGPVMLGVDEFRMVIYDRWGTPVFETEDEDWWWNGSPDNLGRSHISDLFAWRIEAQGVCDAKRVYTGMVQLIR